MKTTNAAIINILNGSEAGATILVSDIATFPALRGTHFGAIERAVKSLVKAGMVTVLQTERDGAAVRLRQS